MQDKLLLRLYALFLAALLAVGGAAAYALRTLARAQESGDWVNHTYATIYEFEHLGALLQQGEGLVRTYALSGDARDLAAAREAYATVAERFVTAKALTRSQPATHEALLRIEALALERDKFAQSLWTARSADRADEVKALLAADAGNPALGTLLRSLGQLRDAEFDRLSDQDREAYAQAQRTRWVVGLGIGLNFVLLLAGGWLLRDDLAARRRAAQALADANAQLEDKVRERTAELLAANQQLRAENLERKWTLASQEHQLRYNQLIVNSVGELVFVLTKALTVTRINAAVVHTTGRTDQAVLTHPLGQVIEVPPEPTSGLDPVARALRDGRELRQTPATILTHDGRRLPARLTLVPLRDADKVVGGVAVVHPLSSPASANTQPA